ncbi:hypothetical protein PR202_gb04988 [Eleusine coracana subsp. coracana]|uniref:F-box domain-containing protein n=1 Tax=Eleusine coracana subsp. coracana TaxID=191504 RepID=A0AAV5E525_ELECO|nr:hypothetical protein PR202_gb04988 [Eleusine coracana subsp. coracana]
MNPPVPKRRREISPDQAAGSVAGSGSYISDDILFFQILILLPVKCLVRLQSVCKSWRATITSTHFVRRHLEISRSRSSVVLVPRKYQKEPAKLGSQFVNIYSFQPGQSKTAKLIFQKKFYPSGIPMFSMPLHCDGLILIPCKTGNIFLCNPATKEFVELPRGSRNVFFDHSFAFGFDTLSGTYKVARHFVRSYVDKPQIDGVGTIREYSCGHEIMTIGVGKDAWGWKATMDPPYPIKARTPICLPGFFYWSALHSEAGHGHGKVSLNVILRFSLHSETFTVHPNPPCRGFLSDNDTLSDLGGKLCYVHSASPWEIAIWLAEDGPVLDWWLCRRVRLPLPRFLRVCVCASADPDKIFLSIDAHHLFNCDLSDGSIEKVVDMAHDVLYDHGDGIKFTTGALPIAHYMVPFVESLLCIAPW